MGVDPRRPEAADGVSRESAAEKESSIEGDPTKEYRLYDLTAGWIGPSSWLYIGIALLAASGAWYAATMRPGHSWPALLFLVLMSTWTLCGGYGARDARKLQLFVASMLALGPELVARTVLGTDVAEFHLWGLFALLVLTFASAIANTIMSGRRISKVRVVRIIGFLIASAALGGLLAGAVPSQVFLLLLALYLGPLFIDSTLHIFRMGWADTLETGEVLASGAMGRVAQLSIRFMRMFRNGGLSLARGLVEDCRHVWRFFVTWADVYLFVWLAFAATKIAYSVLSAATVAYIDEGGLVLLPVIALASLLAILTHTIAAASLVSTPAFAKPRVSSHLMSSTRKILSTRIDDAIGVWATAVCCVIPLPGLLIWGVTGVASPLWLATLGAMLAAAFVLRIRGSSRALVSFGSAFTHVRRGRSAPRDRRD